MSEKYTPTTEQVRDGYRYDPVAEYYDPVTPHHIEGGRAFDRWYAAEIAAAEKRGWDECVNEADNLGLIHDIGVREMLARNPHRADRIEEGT